METEKQTCGWFVFNSGQVLIEKKKTEYHIPYGPEPPVEVPVGSTIHTIGEINGYPAKTYAIHIPVSGDENSPRMMKDLRASFDVLPLKNTSVRKSFTNIELGQEQPLLPHVWCTYYRFPP